MDSACSLGSRTLGLLVVLMALAAGSVARAQVAAQEAVDGLRLVEITMAKGYENREPVDPTNNFRVSDGRIYVVLRIANSTGAPTVVRVTFERADRDLEAEAAGGTVLPVPPSRHGYRTVARTGTRAPGQYRAVVRTAEGNVLGNAEYTVAE